jgi:hypothetical protein
MSLYHHSLLKKLKILDRMSSSRRVTNGSIQITRVHYKNVEREGEDLKREKRKHLHEQASRERSTWNFWAEYGAFRSPRRCSRHSVLLARSKLP